MAKKRTKLEVTRDLLNVLKSGKKTIVTHLIYKANLSNNSIKEYLENLLKNGLVREVHENNKRFFVITSRGQSFLEEYQKISIFADAYGLDY